MPSWVYRHPLLRPPKSPRFAQLRIAAANDATADLHGTATMSPAGRQTALLATFLTGTATMTGEVLFLPAGLIAISDRAYGTVAVASSPLGGGTVTITDRAYGTVAVADSAAVAEID